MNLPTRPATSLLLPKPGMLAWWDLLHGGCRSDETDATDLNSAPHPLDPRAADRAIHCLIPMTVLLLRCLTNTVRDQRSRPCYRWRLC
jgi:hypothetical protein